MKFKKYIYITLIVLGVLLVLYPIVRHFEHEQSSMQSTNDFEEYVQSIQDKDREQLAKEIEKYNQSTLNQSVSDPYSSGQEVYKINDRLAAHDVIGEIIIPKIQVKEPIYEGTSDTTLQKGIGHLSGTSFPSGGMGTHTMLAGHRGLPGAALFSRLNELEIGDTFSIYTVEGLHTYEVISIDTILPEAFQMEPLDANQDLATLVTCTPYMINSHRLLVTGTRVEKSANVGILKPLSMNWIVLASVGFLLVAGGILFWEIRCRRK